IMNFSDYIGNDDFRSALKNIAEVLGNDYLFNRLKVVDPKTFDKLHPNDLRRIIRALEVYQFTGKPISLYQELSSKRMNPEYDVVMIGLNFRDRNKLYKRIDDRVDIMLKNNLVNEVVNLLKIGYNKYGTSMQALGYKEIAEYLDGNVTFEEAINNLKKRTRRYAKRQITWFKSYKIINWFYVDDYIDFEELKKNIICFLAGKLNFK
ncbi:MAG: tRNA dimethylallyltransferase, partial [Thermoanaerobacterium sp.]|nr:tRNA dimethylallyltransferase [Thermoanaerobacterium sp.]